MGKRTPRGYNARFWNQMCTFPCQSELDPGNSGQMTRENVHLAAITPGAEAKCALSHVKANSILEIPAKRHGKTHTRTGISARTEAKCALSHDKPRPNPESAPQMTRETHTPHTQQSKNLPRACGRFFLAVAAGFEPAVGGYPTLAFEASTFGRSDTLPSISL